MYIYLNENPNDINNGDCVIRAISTVLGQSWHKTFWDLCIKASNLADLPNSDLVFGSYLKSKGFFRYYVPNYCSDCYTVREFCKEYQVGKYVISCGEHVLASINGDYYDTLDSGLLVPLYFWKDGERL